MSPRRVVVRAPAKINLGLEVLGRRADGFHEIDTVLLALELADRLAVEERAHPGLELVVRGPAAEGVPADETNLALRAARAILEIAAGRGPHGLRLELEKNVPVAAGLGGGSSDAAAAVLATAQLAGLDPDDPVLLGALAQLGSDCAFFLAARESGLARCTGRGEIIAPCTVAWPWWVVLVTPSWVCSTAAVYRAWTPRPEPMPRSAGSVLAQSELAELRRRLVNDLEPAALRVEPELVHFRALLEDVAPDVFRLSGSGSSWFGLFADASEASVALERLRSAARARRYALRGAWLTRASGRGAAVEDKKSLFGEP